MTFRVGVVGVGAIGTAHLQAAAALPDVSVAAVCDTDGIRAESAAREYQAQAFVDWRDLLDKAALDGVVVALPHALHADVTVAAAAAGVHVLAEKPMATTVEDCDTMVDACAAANVVLAVCHVLHHPRRLVLAKKIAESAELGRLVTISIRRSTHYLQASRPQWFLEKEAAGGGILFNLGAHAMDLVQWLGNSPIGRVRAQVATSDPSLSVETDGAALVELANGVPASIVAMGTAMPTQDDVDLVFVDGVLRSSHRNGLWRYQRGTGTQLVAPAQNAMSDAYRAMLVDFVTATRTGSPPETDGRWGRSVVAAVQCVYASSDSGDWTSVLTPVQR